MTTPLRIGMIGYGFMGRAHTNGYKRVGDFFPDLEYRPVLKAACARNAENIQAFADQWGYESIETDWRELLEARRHRRGRHLRAEQLHREIAIACGRSGQDDPLREAASQ